MSQELDTLQAETRKDHVWSTEAFTALTEPGTLWADKKGLLPPKDLSEIQEQLDIGKGIQGFWMRFWASRMGKIKRPRKKSYERPVSALVTTNPAASSTAVENGDDFERSSSHCHASGE